MGKIDRPKYTDPRAHNRGQWLDDYLDPEQLMILRVSRGKSRPDMAKVVMVKPETYSRYESSKMSRWTLGISRLRKVCQYLDLNPLEVCQLLKYKWIPDQEVDRFKSACSKEDVKPKDVLRQMMRMYVRATKGVQND